MDKENKNKSVLKRSDAAKKAGNKTGNKAVNFFKKSKLKVVLRLVGNTLYNALFLLILLVTLNALVGTVSRRQPFIFGYSVSQILSESMAADGFYKNDYIIARKVKDASELKVANPQTGERGDFITFYIHSDRRPLLDGEDRSDSRVLFHEIVGVSADGKFITKGSSNISVDPYEVPFQAISGKYIKTGAAMDFIVKAVLADNRFLYWVIAVLVLIILRQILSFFYSLRDLKLQREILKGKRNLLDKKCLERNFFKDFTNRQKNKIIAAAPEGLKALYEFLLYSRVTSLSDARLADRISNKRCNIDDVLHFTYSKEADSAVNIDEYIEKLPKKKKKFEKYSNAAQFKRESAAEMLSAVSLFFGAVLFLCVYVIVALALKYFSVADWYEILFAFLTPVFTLIYLYLVFAENKSTAVKLKKYLETSAELPRRYQFILQPESFSQAEAEDSIAEINRCLSGKT